ncbi:hypothetical protein [Micromonospora sp. NBC_01796]|uniref:hypothetical protein n=1 Tax=Micromonospora sp. NBC_01796 TaxID=2975987 RepID=UPI002DD8931D|nr:hypothetical protein [Micromonospora sp. NBC_01796]WSA83961.1 neutral zinc metallopeptidase [Micromonospora sp. NBC_01796]
MRRRIPALLAATVLGLGLTPGPVHAAPPASVSGGGGIVAPPQFDFATARAAANPETQARIAAIAALLPENWQAMLADKRERMGLKPSLAQELVAEAIDPSLYQCQDTQFSTYTQGLIEGVDLDTLLVLVIFGVLDYAAYDALIYGQSNNEADYGLPASQKSMLKRTFKDAQQFWDVDLFDVKFMAMQNDMLQDPARVARMVSFIWGMDEDQAAAAAAEIMAIINSVPALDAGRNPIFTLNAFAFTAEGETDPLLRDVPDKVVFGEGMITALDALGLGTAGSRAVLAHEMAHHVQFEQGLFDSPLTGAEATRRTELMADGFGTYFVTHPRGLNFNGVQIHQAQQAFYEVGDCSFDNPGHHGTPNQRLRASVWGAQIAQQATGTQPILPSMNLFNRFERKLPALIKPDARPEPAGRL